MEVDRQYKEGLLGLKQAEAANREAASGADGANHQVLCRRGMDATRHSFLQRLHGVSPLGLMVPRSPGQGLCHAGLHHP